MSTAAELPSELWRRILVLATSIPSQVEVLHDVHLFAKDLLEQEMRALYGSNVSTKLSIVLVCKAWLAVGIELLYQELRPPSVRCLESMKNTLIRQSERTNHSNQRYGWWTRELEIPNPDYKMGAISLVIDILHLFPNLTVLIIQHHVLTSSTYHESFANALHRWTPKLQYLNCHQFDIEIGAENSAIIQHVPSVRALRSVLGKLPHTYNQNITSLALLVSSPDLPNFTFPFLNVLIFSTVMSYLQATARFIEVHGKQLHTLGLGEHTNGATPFGDGGLLLEQILRICPNLRQLLLGRVTRRTDSEVKPMVLSGTYPTITLLGIPIANRRLTQEDWERTYPFQSFPGLRRIRLLDVLSRRSMSKALQARRSPNCLESFPARFVYEDALGNDVDCICPEETEGEGNG